MMTNQTDPIEKVKEIEKKVQKEIEDFKRKKEEEILSLKSCLLYTSPSPRDRG